MLVAATSSEADICLIEQRMSSILRVFKIVPAASVVVDVVLIAVPFTKGRSE